ncbi:MAG TPA: APC family permease [Parafilimonas sp.]|nr:APC family permease [Parafilimonas sp.]
MSSSLPRKKRLPLFQLVAVIFLTVSGGPYGLEPLLTYAGNNGALLLLIITPLLWDVPTIFFVLELNSMMPVTGGYYQWVKRALGLRFAFYEGWWTWLYTFVDLAIYPVLFVEYASYFFPGIEAYKIPICLIIIWAGAGLNILGIVPVGETSVVLGIAVIAPFIILFITAFASHNILFSVPHPSLSGMHFSTLGLALFTVMWNFCGWDNTMTYAEEVDKPVRSYITSTVTAFAIIFAVYFITILTSQASGISYNVLNDEGFPAVGSLIGGNWLGALIAAGGMASTLGLFSAVLLSVSRVPKVMSDDKLLPKKLHAIHSKFKTPYISIIVCALIVSFMILWTFADLLIIDITLYGAGLFLEFLSLIVLRKKMTHAHRPFKIKLNIAGLWVITIIPFSVYLLGLSGSFAAGNFSVVLFAVVALLSAEIIWQLINYFNPEIKHLKIKID